MIEFFSSDIGNGKRVEEVILILELIDKKECSVEKLREIVEEKYNHEISDDTIKSLYKNLNFEFITEKSNKKILTVREIYDFNIVKLEGERFIIEDEFLSFLEDEQFKFYLMDILEYSILEYERNYKEKDFYDGFVLYEKYSRKDILRILNWDKNEVGVNVGGYKVNLEKGNCPIFINYHKAEDISETTKYDDGFIDTKTFKWMSKSKRTLESPDVKAIRKGDLRLPLFIRKNDKDIEFYYIGDLSATEDKFIQTTMPAKNNKEVSVVHVTFTIEQKVEEKMYRYIMEA